MGKSHIGVTAWQGEHAVQADMLLGEGPQSPSRMNRGCILGKAQHRV